MTPLPIDPKLPEIVAAVRAARAVVLVAEPGAGKTTRVPPAILAASDLLLREHPNLVMLQPRRVAARAAAMRIAEERGWTLGEQVGYHVRFDRKLGPRTRMRVLTEGILTRQLLDDPFLDGVGCVVLDEFHERSLHTDTAIALLREVRRSVREDLILVVMSATLEAEPVARFLGDCPIVRVEGRTFPIEIEYRGASGAALEQRVADEIQSALHTPWQASETSAAPDPSAISRPIRSGARASLAPAYGDMLVFLPGAEEIRRAQREIERTHCGDDLLVLPLHGSLTAEEQDLALRPPPRGRRKIVLATNIAETSLTIDGITTVIDSGLARVAGYEAERGLDRLELKRISKASAAQRAGRAGRTAPGRCVRLWSAKEHNELANFELPEIRRVDLAGTVLSLHAWGIPDVRNFGWYDAPTEESLLAAERLLAMLGALSSEADGRITPLGRQLVALPLHPRLARLMLAAAEQGLLREAATMAALLSEKDIVVRFGADDGAGRGGATLRAASDLLVRMQMLERGERHDDLDPAAVRQVIKTRNELLRIAERTSRGQAKSPPDEIAPLKLLLLAYPDRVCKRRPNDPQAGVMVGGSGVRLARESVVAPSDAEFFLALDARRDQRNPRSEALVRIASRIEESWLEELFADQLRSERTVVFDESRQRVVALGQVFYRDLLLREDKDAPVDPEQATKALAEAVRPRAREFFEADESAAALLARVDLLRRQLPEQAWPAFDDAKLGEILADASHGKRSIDDLRRASLASLLRARLVYPLDRLLDTEAPETIAVPSGNRIRLDYSNRDAPILAVRLQELFGWTETPRIARGRVPVLLHLLGPNFRPVQVTSDLASFWRTTYPQVRKDLRARYPKHSWPEDPFTAKPEAKGARRR